MPNGAVPRYHITKHHSSLGYELGPLKECPFCVHEQLFCNNLSHSASLPLTKGYMPLILHAHGMVEQHYDLPEWEVQMLNADTIDAYVLHNV